MYGAASPAVPLPPPLKAVPADVRKNASKRSQRRQQFLKKRQFQFRFNWLTGLRRVVKLLAVVALIFILLPSSMQKKVYSILPFAESKPVVSMLPPLPVNYDYISSPFGHRWGRQHQGIDFAATVGEPIYAMSAGTVVHSGWEHGYGKSVVLDHGNGVETRYGHCSKLLVKEGQQIAKGDVIGLVGSTGHSTGPHLHFEVIVDGVRKNPAWYFSFTNHPVPHLANASEDRHADNGHEDGLEE